MPKQQETADRNGHDDEVARYEKELAGYLQERIKPGLNSGAIPMLARSIAKEIAQRDHPNGASEHAEAANGGSPEGEAPDDDGDDFEDEMHELQEELGEDWILSFSVKGDDAWLTAEKDDGSQRLEAPSAAVLSEAVQLLNEGGGRSG